MALAELCDMGGNYIGQIEMGRRIPSFEKIEKIAAALDIDIYLLFMQEGETGREKEPGPREFLLKLPAAVKREITSRFLSAAAREISASLDAKNYTF